MHVYKKRDAKMLQENLTNIINPTKKVRDLEQKLQFSETYENRIKLADAYFEIQDYNNALKQYLSALDSTFQNDFHVIEQIISCYYKNENYDRVIDYSKQVINHIEFKRSKVQFLYGLSLEKTGDIIEAEKQLKQLDLPYSNYTERLAYINFLIRHDKTEAAKTLLNEVFDETQNMTKMNRKLYKQTIIEIEKLKTDF
ncbi:hypothetical protein [uncultured Psychroserpens sp.]|uniref:hypothetical protein n=1 Tax=uncultured Psychroserpens sp. TaxID=255436 RepID=UPI00261C4196|nr:hypothetical protein [uncultured Psychroserpens sp.]